MQTHGRWYKDALLDFLREHKIINACQQGFTTRKSTTTHLFECNLDWNTAIKSRNGVDIAHADIARAFDSVVYTKLLAKLQCCSVCGMKFCWIDNFPCY